MVVSPTYFGACADVAALAEVAHERGVPLVVDEAWGAHLHFHPDAARRRARLRRRPRHLLDPQDRRQPHPGGDAPPRRRRPDRRGGGRPLRQPGRDDQPQRPALAARSTRPGARPRSTASELLERDAGGDRRDPRGDRADPGPRRARRAAWSAAPGSPAGTRCGSRSTCAAPARPATGWRRPPSTRSATSTSSCYSENVVVAIFGMGEPARAAGERLVAGAARGGRAARGRAGRRASRSWRRRRPGASW